MVALQSNADAILVAIPMVGMLFIGFFRLDEVLSSPRKPAERGHALSGWDENGLPLCVEPDGRMAQSGSPRPTPAFAPPVPRVRMEWGSNDSTQR